MPKRIIDGDALWHSQKIAQVQPPKWRAEYANLLPLALANGVFECNAHTVWATVYADNRDDIEPADIEQILAEFERVKLLFRWTDAQTQKQWGFWVGIEKPGRLPPKTRRYKHAVMGPEAPQEELRKFLACSLREADVKPAASLREADGCLGIGTGIGVGKDQEEASSSEVPDTSDKKTHPEPSEDGWKLARLQQAELVALKPDFRISDATLRAWAETADLMFRLDKRDPGRAADLMGRVYRDDFWRGNVLSMRKFRQKFDQLELKLVGKPNPYANKTWVRG